MKKITLLLLLLASASVFSQSEFITKWNAPAANESITIPITMDAAEQQVPAVSIDWGDGASGTTTYTANNYPKHTYTSASTTDRTVTITPIAGHTFKIYFNNEGDKDKITDITEWGDIKWSTMENAFQGCSNLKVTAIKSPDLSKVEDASAMFAGATSFTGVGAGINSWNLENVIYVNSMFEGATNFNGDVSGWFPRGSKVTDMSGMFDNDIAFNQPLNSWDVSNVKKMNRMFSGAMSFNQDLNSWDVRKVKNMQRMFYNPTKPTKNYAFNGSLATWDVSNVETIDHMFFYANNFNQDLKGWKVSKVTDFTGMLEGAKRFDGDVSNWVFNSSSDINMNSIFSDANVFTGKGIKSWEVKNVVNMKNLFFYSDFGAAAGDSADITGWKVGNVTDMSGMLYGIKHFNQDLSSWDVSKVTDMSSMLTGTHFNNNSPAKWDISSVTTMENMFRATGISTDNYDDILIGWNTLTTATGETNIPENVKFTNGISSFCKGAAARVSLAEKYGWTITDGGISSSCKDAFITRWKVGATVGTRTITLPTDKTSTYNYLVDWGDGTTEIGSTSYASRFPIKKHTYLIPVPSTDPKIPTDPTILEYNIKILIDFPHIDFKSSSASKDNIISVSQWGTSKWKSMENAFYGCSYLTITATDLPGLSSVTDMSGMFQGATSLNSSNLRHWVLTKVTNMSHMFDGAKAFSQNLKDWEFSTVTDMSGMFKGASAFEQNLKDWNFSAVTDMNNMFNGATAFTGKNLNSWGGKLGKVSKVENMSGMFEGATAFNQDISSWDVSKVTDMSNMFKGATAFTGEKLGTWGTNVSKVENMSGMFEGATAFNQDISGWTVSAVTNMSNMFKGATLFNSALGWGTKVGAVENMSGMFEGATAFNQDISGWTVSAVTDMSNMFNGATAFTGKNLGTWATNVSKVENMSEMFQGATAFNQDISGWKVSAVTDMSNMFNGATKFTGKSLGNWDISSVVTPGMTDMFKGVTLPTANYDNILIGWNTLTTGETKIPTGITFSGGDSQYCAGATARASLESTHTWTITDGGIDSACKDVFITTWETTADDNSITIPTDPASTYDYIVDWGDGSDVKTGTGDVSHPYTTAGTHTVKIIGTFPRILFKNDSNAKKIRTVKKWGDNAWTSMANAFYGSTNLTITATDSPNLTSVTDMSNMFNGATSLIGTTISAWNVSKITNMSNMFKGATLFNTALGWGTKVGAVENMSGMFEGATAFNQDISSWTVSAVTDMSNMFNGATTFTGKGLGNWDIGNVNNMTDMFKGVTLPTANYDNILIGWNALTTGKTKIPTGITFSGGDSKYCAGATARASLESTYTWTITDGGIDSACKDVFITTWETTADDNSITIPTDAASTYEYIVDWGDGSEVKTGDASHPYTTAGTHTVKIIGTFPRILFKNDSGNAKKIRTVKKWGDNAWTSMANAFYGSTNLTITATDSPNLTSVTDMSNMFNGATSLVGTTTSAWDVSKVENMSSLFSGAVKFNGDLSSWKVSKVEDMSHMFEGATSFAGTGLGSWDVSGVTNMLKMFAQATSFNQDISSWDVSKVTNMSNMFDVATTFTGKGLGNWDISKVGNMTKMFNGVTLPTYNYDNILIGWNALTTGETKIPTGITFDAGYSKYCAGKVARANLMSEYNWSINDGKEDSSCENSANKGTFITTWETTKDDESITIPTNGSTSYTVDWGESDGTPEFISKTGDVSHEYATKGLHVVRIKNLSQIYFNNVSTYKDKIRTVEKWGDNAWTSMANAFYGSTNLTITATDSPNLTSVTDMSNMFNGATSLVGTTTSAWDVSKVENMSSLFSGAVKFNGDLSSWKVSKVEDMSHMFEGATSFAGTGLGSWDVSGVTNMLKMFAQATSFNQDISSWDVSKVTNMSNMFDVATTFTGKGLGNWDISKVGNMTKMFNGVTLPTYNYDNILIGWNALTTGETKIPTGITFDAGYSKYCAGKVARANLMSEYNWSINDGKEDSSCENSANKGTFITTWETTKDDESITIPTNGSTSYTVDWGESDGTPEFISKTGDVSHEYATKGLHVVRIKNLSQIYFNNVSTYKDKIRTVEKWGDNAWTSMANAFYGSTNLTITATDSPNLTSVTDMSNMFNGATSLVGTTTSAWDVSKVENMSSLFSGAVKFNGDLSSWKVSKVEDMSHMFEGATSFAGTGLGSWDVSGVTNMLKMFAQATSFNQDISSWDVSKVTNMSNMFDVATTFTGKGLGNWDISKVGNMTKMFNGVTLPTYNYDNILIGWNALTTGETKIPTGITFDAGYSKYCAGKVARANLMSEYNWSINDGKEDSSCENSANKGTFITTWETTKDDESITIPTNGSTSYTVDWGESDGTPEFISKTGDVSHKYATKGLHVVRIKNLSQIYFNNVSTSKDKIRTVEKWGKNAWSSMANAFYGSTNLTITATDSPNLTSVTDMSNMFNGATSLVGTTTSAWDVSKVENMSSLFSGAVKFNGDISAWDVSKVTNMSSLFSVAVKFNGDISSWDVSKVTDMSGMFSGASIFNGDISSWDVSKVTNMSNMFNVATTFTGKGLGNWDISKVGNMTDMFKGVTLPTYNYDNILIGWNALTTGETKIPTGITFDAGYSKYCAGKVARANLMSEYNWSINDGKEDSSCENSANKGTFITTWETTKDDESITIPTNGSTSYTVDWGESDGTPEFISKTGDVSHKYATKGLHVVRIKNLSQIYFNNVSTSKDKIRTVEKWGKNAWSSMANAFYGSTNLTITATDSPNLTSVTDMSNMFNGATSLVGTTTSAWDVSKVTNMSSLFSGAVKFNGDLSSWKVSKVEDMSHMFEGATSFAGTGLGSWDVSGVTNMLKMFAQATSFNQDISSWDVSKVTNMSNMFDVATTFTGKGLGNWDISKVGNMTDMFKGVTLPTYNYDNILIGWNALTTGETKIPTGITFDAGYSKYCAGKVARANLMSEYNWSINDGKEDSSCENSANKGTFITTWETTKDDESITIPTNGSTSYTVDWGESDGTPEFISKTGDVSHKYATKGLHVVRIKNLSQIYFNNVSPSKDKIKTVEKWGDNAWTSMANAFYGSTKLTITATDSPNLSGVTDMSNMFNGATSLVGTTTSAWDVSKVENMSSLFSGAVKFNGDISSWDVSKVTDMSGMFSGASIFNGDISSWDVSKVTDMSGMFSGASIFNGDISSWDVSKVTDMSNMFNVATTFTGKGLGNWDISSVVTPGMTDMFKGVTLPTYNYDNILIGWNALTTGETKIPTGITFDAGYSKYCAGKVARANLMSEYNWSINDGKEDSSCENSANKGTFITTWETTKDDESITIPTNGSTSYTVDWGESDGTPEFISKTGDVSHKYATKGLHVVRIKNLSQIYFNNVSTSKDKIRTVEKWGKNAWSSMANAFYGSTNLTITATDSPNLTSVTDMSNMFNGATSLVGTTTSAWDVSKVTNMSSLFSGAVKFNGDISAWDVSKVTNMSNMFNKAIAFTGKDLGSWDISKVENMTDMFKGVTLPTANYDNILIGWNTISTGETGIPTKRPNQFPFNAGYSKYCAGKAARANLMSEYKWSINDGKEDSSCEDSENKGTFITTWETTADGESIIIPTTGTGYSYTVNWGDDSTDDSGQTGDISHEYATKGLHVVKITGGFPRILFKNDSNAKKIRTVEKWGDNAWTSMANAFYGSTKLTITATDSPNLSGVTDMSNMFKGATSLVGTTTSAWDVSKVTDMSGMFSGASIFNGDISSWDVSKVTNMSNMFDVATTFTGKGLGNWDISKVGNMTDMFKGVTLPTYNYDNILIGWNALTTGETKIPTGITFNAGGSKYCAGKVARANLMSEYNWSISDGKEDSSCENSANKGTFITTWETTKDDESITIPTNGSTSYTVDWGESDGTPEFISKTGDVSHKYATKGLHVVRIKNLSQIYFNNVSPSKDKIKTVEKWGDNAWTSMANAFYGSTKLTITATDSPNLSGVTDMSNMFNGATSLVGTTTSAWDVSKVENMSSLFSGAVKFNGDISSWDVSKVTDMSGMFSGASIFNGDISSWDVSKVTNMSNMFDVATTFTGKGLGNWDISKVGNMTDMFKGVTLPTYNYDNILIGWNALTTGETKIPTGITFDAGYSKYCAGKVARANLMSEYNWSISDGKEDSSCENSANKGTFITTWETTKDDESITIPTNGSTSYTVDWGESDGTPEFISKTGDVSHKYATKGLHVVRIKNLSQIYFNNVSPSKDKIKTVEKWGDNAWTSMANAFYGSTKLTITATDSPNLSGVTDMSNMFNGATSLVGTTTSAWDVSKVENMSSLFSGAVKFNGDISSWDVSKVTDMSGMFSGASIFNGDISSWDVSKVTDMSNMFDVATTFTGKGLGNWDISSVVTPGMTDMFKGVTLPTYNYDNILIGWNALTTGETKIPTGITFNAGGSKYCAGKVARANLMSEYNWSISDGKEDSSCENSANKGTFITTWETTKDDESITIPTNGSTSYTVDWGESDGTPEFISKTGDVSHEYATKGLHVVRIKNLSQIYFNNVSPSKDKIKTVEKWGDNAWTSMANAFYGSTKLTITATDSPNLSGVTDMSNMFNGATSLVGTTTSAWDVSKVENMSSLFSGAVKFNGDISSWDVSKVTDMSGMFSGASIFNGDISSWDVSKVTDMSNMFDVATTFTGKGLGNWDISSVITPGMTDMFKGVTLPTYNYDNILIGWNALTTGETKIPTGIIFNAGGSKYCAGKAARANLMSEYKWSISDGKEDSSCENSANKGTFITTWETTKDDESIDIPTNGSTSYTVDWGESDGTPEFISETGDVSHEYATKGLHVVRIKNLSQIYFNNVSPSKDKIKTVEKWGDNAWTSMANAFYGSTKLTITATDSPNLSGVTDMSNMFNGATSLVGTTTSAWDVSKVENMSSLFSGAVKFNGDISSWKVSKVTDMSGMFSGASIFNGDISSWDVSKVTDMSNMFDVATTFTGKGLGNWDISSVVTPGMTDMFKGVTLPTANYDNILIGWNTISTGETGITQSVIFNAGGSKYCLGAAAKSNLSDKSVYNWTISDGGPDEACITANKSTFITTWETTKDGESIIIPTDGASIYKYTVDWGDGNKDSNQTGDVSHEYAKVGTHTVKITGTFPHIDFSKTSASKDKIRTVEKWGDNAWTSMEGAFKGSTKLTITATDSPNLSGVTDMSNMFNGATSLVGTTTSAWDVSKVENMSSLFSGAEKFNGDISSWKVGEVTDMSSMLNGAVKFNQNLGIWDVSKVENMSNMFNGASIFNGDLSSWDVSGVTNMLKMFAQATNFNQDISSWDVSKVTDMSNMFDGAIAFTGKDLGSWDISSVAKPGMTEMFAGVTLPTANYDNILIGWNTLTTGETKIPTDITFDAGGSKYCAGKASRANLKSEYKWSIDDGKEALDCEADTKSTFITTWETTADGESITIPTTGTGYSYTVNWGDDSTDDSGKTGNVSHSYSTKGLHVVKITGTFPRIDFSKTSASKDKIRTVEKWGDNAWTSMEGAFKGSTKLEVIDTNSPNLSKVTDMSNMFNGATSLIGTNTSAWDVSGVENMSSLFNGAVKFNGDISSWKVGEVTNMSSMLSGAVKFNQDLGIWDVSKVENMSNMFNGASIFNGDISSWNVSGVTDMSYMFNEASKFNKDINQWSVDKVENMNHMFFKATEFDQDISKWNVGKVKDMNSMFSGAIAFTGKGIGIWDVSNVSDMSDTFNEAIAFTGKGLGSWDISSITNMSGMFAGVTLPTANYDKILIGWNIKTTGETKIPVDNEFDGGNSKYCLGAAARANLIDKSVYNWKITDGGPNKTCISENKGTFITTWETTTSGEEITIPTDNKITSYNYTVDWGDGTTSTETDNAKHTYATKGLHIVKIVGSFPHIYFNNVGSSKDNIRSIEQWGTISWQSMEGSFYGCTELTSYAIDAPDLRGVTDMSNMFNGASEFNGNLSRWNLEKVNNVSSMFKDAISFTGRGIDAWNVGEVTDMSSIFSRATSFNQDINNWDVSKVEDMSSMFEEAIIFNQVLDKWAVGEVKDMRNMFRGASSFNQDIKSWDVSKVEDMSSMFYESSKFDQDLGNWDISSVEDMTDMFTGIVLSTYNYDNILIGWNIKTTGEESIPTGVPFNGGGSMYCVGESARAHLQDTAGDGYGWTINDGGLDNNCKKLSFVTSWETTTDKEEITIPIDTKSTYNYTVDWGDGSNLETKTGEGTHEYSTKGIHVVRITGLFPRIYFNNSGDKEKIRSIEQWGKNPWTSMEGSFYGSKNLTSDALDSPDLSGVENTSDMFRDASSYNGKVGSWNVSNVTNMSNMFNGATSFDQDLGKWDISSILSPGMTGMFAGATLSTANYDSLLIGWNTLDESSGEKRIPTEITFDGGYSTYCEGREARINLKKAYSWIITDGGGAPGCVKNAFITTWETTGDNESITIPTDNRISSYDYDVVWGDGSAPEAFDNSNATHTYAKKGNYTVLVTGEFPHIYFNNSGDKVLKIKTIEQWGIIEWKSMKNAFYGCVNLTNNATDIPDLKEVTTMQNMFRNTSFNGKVKDWDVSKVTNMSGVFRGDIGFVGEGISDWDVSKVTDMRYMFMGATDFDQNLGKWNISQVVHMEEMLSGIAISTDNYDDTVIGWDTLNESLGETKIPRNITFDPGNSLYCRGEFAIGSLTRLYSWYITKVKKDPKCLYYKLDDLKVYPNPTRGIIHINFIGQIKQVRIYSVIGEIVKVVDKNFDTIDVSSLKDGVYILNIITKEGTKSVKLIKE